jgi:hypothetical protein
MLQWNAQQPIGQEGPGMSAPQRVIPDPRVEAAIEFTLGLRIHAPWATNGQRQIILNPPMGPAQAKRADRIAVVIQSLPPHWRFWPGVGIHGADGVRARELFACGPLGWQKSATSSGCTSPQREVQRGERGGSRAARKAS